MVIELNGLKIAEDRTFADCARYMLTALLNLGLPPPPRTPAEYLPLFKTGERARVCVCMRVFVNVCVCLCVRARVRVGRRREVWGLVWLHWCCGTAWQVGTGTGAVVGRVLGLLGGKRAHGSSPTILPAALLTGALPLFRRVCPNGPYANALPLTPAPAAAAVAASALPPAVAPEASKEGQLALLRGFKQALADWRDLLQRFLKSEDDQVRRGGEGWGAGNGPGPPQASERGGVVEGALCPWKTGALERAAGRAGRALGGMADTGWRGQGEV